MSVPIARSEAAFAQARGILVGGVNSPVRAYGRVGGTPRFLARGAGCHVWDVDGNEYVDLVMGWGPLILGHAHSAVRAAIDEALRDGWGFGAPTEAEHRLAEEVRRRMPSIERLRMVSSGTEATMSALRVARAHTGRAGFIKFEGAYHGHADPFLSKAGSGAATTGTPDSAGVPDHVARDARTVAFNDLEAVERVARTEAASLAAVIVEPVAANMSLVPPRPVFLRGLREVCDRHDLVLIFDEVITGFRTGRGGAQETYGVRPDLTTLGKVLGGGLPLAAYGGRQDLMRLVAPEGPVYQAGTMAGNPVAVAAGHETLRHLTSESYEQLESTSRHLEQGLRRAVGEQAQVQRVASLLGLSIAKEPATDWARVARADSQAYARLFHALLDKGVYAPPSPYESLFLSTAHRRKDVDHALEAIRQAWQETLPHQVSP